MGKGFIFFISCTLTLGLCASCEEHVKDLPPSEIYINMPIDGYEVEVNDTIIVSPKITYDYNSTYEWQLNDELIWQEKDLQLIPTYLHKSEYTFTVTNDRGTASLLIPVQAMYKTDFEELELEKNTFWTNADQNISLVSDKIKFETMGNYEAEIWTGFTYSNLSGGNTVDDYEKYSCYKKPINYTSEVFGVAMLDAYGKPIALTTNDGEDHLFKSISINNSYYVYDAINNGKHGSKKFGGTSGSEKDWLKLTVTGFNKSGTQRGSVEIMLADYTSGSNRDKTILEVWTTLPLKQIGKVSRLEFVMTSSDSDAGKINTPPFVCIDEIKIIE